MVNSQKYTYKYVHTQYIHEINAHRQSKPKITKQICGYIQYINGVHIHATYIISGIYYDTNKQIHCHTQNRHTHTHTYIYAHIHVHIYIHINRYTQIYREQTCLHTHSRYTDKEGPYTHMHINTYTYIQVETDTQS